MTEHGFSQRRACRLIGFDRSTARYRCRRPDDAGLRSRLRALAAERRRFGYRRLGVLLAREGLRVNHKKLYRLYREERLAVRRRGGRKRALGTRRPMTIPQSINERWSLDFASDARADIERDPALGRAVECRMALHRPHKPVQNAFAESFIGASATRA